MSNPIEVFLSEKRAMDFGDASDAAEIGAALGSTGRSLRKSPLLKSVGRGVALGGAFALGSAGVAAVGAAANKMYDAMTKKRDFEAMLDANPHLRAYQEREPESFNHAFSALRAMNPAFSRDPLVAGAYLFESMEQPAETRGFVAVKALRESVPTRLGPKSEAAVSGFHRALGMKPNDLRSYFEPEGGHRDH